MNYLKTGISRVGEFFGNVPDVSERSPSQVADQQSPMPNVPDAEISLAASRSAKNERIIPRAARVKAHAQTNLNVKRQIFEGDYPGDPYEVTDDDNEIEEIPPPKIPTYNEDRDITISARQQQGLRGLGQSRQDAADEEERLLGPNRRRSSVRQETVTVNVPTRDMAARRRVPFTSGGLQPVNTLNDKGRSELINTRRVPQQKQNAVLPNARASTSREPISAYVNEAEGSPPRKRQRTETGHQVSLTDRSSKTHLDESEDPLHDVSTLTVSERAKKAQLTPGVRHTALRRLSQTNAVQMRPSDIPAEKAGFTKAAANQRRQQENLQSSRPSQTSLVTPLKKPNAPPGVSKTHRRLNGEARKSESPDILQRETSAINLLSPPALEEVEYAKFDLKAFFCQGTADVDEPNCYVAVCAESLHIYYKTELHSKHALFRLPYSKITICKVEDDKEDAAIAQLGLRGAIVPANVCYLTFKSPKQSFEFTHLIQKYWSHYKILKVESGWAQNALASARTVTNNLSRVGRTQMQVSTHEDQKLQGEPSHAHGQPNPAPRKKLARLDPSDRPPEQYSAGSKPTPTGMAPQIQRITRSRHSDSIQDDNSSAFPEPHNFSAENQTSKRTRSRTVRQIEIDDDVPREKPEPRVTGPAWDKPLTYPPKGTKKQTIEWADLKRLEDEELLNDNIVGLFLRYIQENADDTHKHQIHTMSTFFYEALMRPTDGKTNRKQINYTAVSKWTKSVDIFARDFVIVPINESLHWYTLLICNLGALPDPKCPIELDSGEDEDVVEERPSVPGNYSNEVSKDILKSDVVCKKSDVDHIDSDYENPKGAKRGPKKKTPRAQRKYDVEGPVIITLDSLDTGGRSGTASMLKDYVIEEGKQKRNLTIDKVKIKGMTAKGIPHQGNFYDCGLYVCLYLERFMVNPRKFVDAVLRREDSALPWPRRLSSSKIRQRFYDFLQELYHAQEEGRNPNVPVLGKILIHDEDYNQPETRTLSDARRPGEPDLERMKNGLRFAETHYKNPSRDHIEDFEEDRTVVASDEHQHEHPFISSLQDYLSQEKETVVINDDDKSISANRHQPEKSPYFAPTEDLKVPQGLSNFDTPKQLAENLRDRRESSSRRGMSKDVIDLSSPVRQHEMPQDLDMEREVRALSVSTEFLSGERSYRNETNGYDQRRDQTRQLPSTKSTAKRTHNTFVIRDSQSDKELDTRQNPSSTYEKETKTAGDIYNRVRNRRDASIVPESHYDEAENNSDDDVEMVDGPVHSSEDLQIISSRHVHHGGNSDDREMLLD